MSKQVLTTGFFYHGDYGHGLIGGSVDRNPTRVDVSDTNNNNDLLIGRKVWTFNIQIISNNISVISPDSSNVNIAIALGEDLYVGAGRVLSVSHSGTIDDKVSYTVQGEFLPNSYFTPTNTNSLHWNDTDGNIIPDGWGYSSAGGVTRSFTVDQYGKSWNLADPDNIDASIGKSYDTGSLYVRFLRYIPNSLAVPQFLTGATTVNLTTSASLPVWLINTFTAAVGDNEVGLAIDIGNNVRYFTMVTGKIEDSLT